MIECRSCWGFEIKSAMYFATAACNATLSCRIDRQWQLLECSLPDVASQQGLSQMSLTKSKHRSNFSFSKSFNCLLTISWKGCHSLAPACLFVVVFIMNNKNFEFSMNTRKRNKRGGSGVQQEQNRPVVIVAWGGVRTGAGILCFSLNLPYLMNQLAVGVNEHISQQLSRSC